MYLEKLILFDNSCYFIQQLFIVCEPLKQTKNNNKQTNTYIQTHIQTNTYTNIHFSQVFKKTL